MKCEIDDARMFLQVMKESSDPLAILREALSNSFDAGATRARVSLDVRSENSVDIEVVDNGRGVKRSEFRYFFGLGFGNKTCAESIGSKGLGTKLYFNGRRVEVVTKIDSGKMYYGTLDDPISSLENGLVPDYEVSRAVNKSFPYCRGTSVKITGLKASSKAPMLSFENVVNYLRWYTVAGSCADLFDERRHRKFRVTFTRIGRDTRTLETSGHELPGSDLSVTDDYVFFAAPFHPFEVQLVDNDGIKLGRLEVAGAIVGPSGHIVSDRRIKKKYKGVFLAKDYFIVRGVSSDVFGGTGEWQNVHIVANCQELELTMGRDDFVGKTDSSPYSESLSALKEFASCIRKGEPFRYRGRVIETGSQFAGSLYSQLKQLKRNEHVAELEHLKALDLLSVSGAPRTILADDGGPVFQPLGRIGLMLYFQALVSKGERFSETCSPGEVSRYRILGYAEESGGYLVLQKKAHGRWSRPLFYKPVMELNDDILRNVKNVDGIVCWSSGNISDHGARDIGVIVLGDQ